MSEKEILLVGGGGHCRSCIDVIESAGTFKIAGIVEQPGTDNNKSILGYPVLGDDTALDFFKKKYNHALITVGQLGSSKNRQRIFTLLKKEGFRLPVVISSLAHVSKYATIGEGTIVMHRAIVNAGARVGQNCILNTGCLIEHDVRIKDHTHISTAAVVNGAAMIGTGSFVGSNATIVQGIGLPDQYFFKAGRLIAGKENGTEMTEDY
jgi:sugar O-acyltransferase (sialic acid O-acetyltransferase NeuD family)